LYEELEVQLHTFLTSVLDGSEWSASRTHRFIYNARSFGTVLWTIWLGYRYHNRWVRFPARPKTFLFAVASRNLWDPCYVGPFRKGEAPEPWSWVLDV